MEPRRAADLDEDDVVEGDTLKGVKKGKAPLDLTSLDHACNVIVDGEPLTWKVK
jgi:hypothetical protein